MSALQVSVLLPTYNRKQLLAEALDSLCRQTLDPKLFEVVVVDNCSTDGTEEMVLEKQAAAPFEIVYRRMEQNGGCFRSINVAAKLARTELMASLDSDCWADPAWLERGLAAFRENPEYAFVAGHIADKPGQLVGFFSLRNGAPAGENLFYPSGNCWYRRSVYFALGGLDENLSFGDVGTSPIGCADSDLAWRMREAGYAYTYRADMIAYHEVKTVPPGAWLRAHWRMVAVPALIRKHPGLRALLRWKLFFLPGNALFYLALAGAAAGAAGYPWALAMALPFVLHAAIAPGRGFSLLRLPRMAARVVMLSVRQAVISGSLIYGSFRARTVVL